MFIIYPVSHIAIFCIDFSCVFVPTVHYYILDFCAHCARAFSFEFQQHLAWLQYQSWTRVIFTISVNFCGEAGWTVQLRWATFSKKSHFFWLIMVIGQYHFLWHQDCWHTGDGSELQDTTTFLPIEITLIEIDRCSHPQKCQRCINPILDLFWQDICSLWAQYAMKLLKTKSREALA